MESELHHDKPAVLCQGFVTFSQKCKLLKCRMTSLHFTRAHIFLCTTTNAQWSIQMMVRWIHSQKCKERNKKLKFRHVLIFWGMHNNFSVTNKHLISQSFLRNLPKSLKLEIRNLQNIVFPRRSYHQFHGKKLAKKVSPPLDF